MDKAFKTFGDELIMDIRLNVTGTPFTGVDIGHCRDPKIGIYDTDKFFTVSGNSPPGYGEHNDAPIDQDDFSSLCIKSFLADTKFFSHIFKQTTKKILSIFEIMGKEYIPPSNTHHNLRQTWLYAKPWVSGPKGTPCRKRGQGNP